MNKVYEFIDTFESDIADKVLQALNSKDECQEVELYKVFNYIYRITPKINFMNKSKMFDKFYATLSNCKVPEEKRVINYYKYICNCLCGIKKDFSKFSDITQDLIGFDRVGDICEF